MSKKIHFNVLSFINEFNLLHKYLVRILLDLLQVLWYYIGLQLCKILFIPGY